MSERELCFAVIEAAKLLGWRVAHFHDSRRDVGGGVLVGDRDAAGFPDLVMVKYERLLFVELKSENGRLSAQQTAWIEELSPLAECYVWRPSDWHSGEIEGMLR